MTSHAAGPAPSEPLPEDLATLVTELVRLAGEARAKVTPLSQEELDWQPAPTSWSVGQVLDHLARINRLYMPALEAALERARARGRKRREPLRPNLLGRWFVAEIEPPPKRRLPVPKRAVPRSSCPKEATLAEFLAAQAAAVDLVHAAAAVDCNGTRFRNPFLRGLPVFNLATGLLVIAAHERRHFEQIDRILAAIDRRSSRAAAGPASVAS